MARRSPSYTRHFHDRGLAAGHRYAQRNRCRVTSARREGQDDAAAAWYLGHRSKPHSVDSDGISVLDVSGDFIGTQKRREMEKDTEERETLLGRGTPGGDSGFFSIPRLSGADFESKVSLLEATVNPEASHISSMTDIVPSEAPSGVDNEDELGSFRGLTFEQFQERITTRGLRDTIGRAVGAKEEEWLSARRR